MKVRYKSGFKYQLTEDYIHKLSMNFPKVPNEIETDWIWLGENTTLTIILKKGYASDGPSGPTIHTKNFMRGAFVHDGLYALIREGHLDKNIYRIHADSELYNICRADGMSWIRANIVYYSVRVFGNPSARFSGEARERTAP